MINNFLPKLAVIKKITTESPDTKTFSLVFKNKKDQKNFSFSNGQFLMAGLAGEGEGAFNICSNPTESQKFFEISVRKIGRLTEAIHQLKVGDLMQIRGPFGKGWPKLENLSAYAKAPADRQTNNLLLVGGGCGFVPLRSVLLEINSLKKKNKLKNLKTTIFYGCANYDSLLFKKELVEWNKKMDLKIIFDKEKKLLKTDHLKCNLGLITKLFDLYPITSEATAFLCGPPIMYKFVLEKLKAAKVSEQNIYLSIERRMECGEGICQHCASGNLYVCKDGPVFRYDEIKDMNLI